MRRHLQSVVLLTLFPAAVARAQTSIPAEADVTIRSDQPLTNRGGDAELGLGEGRSTTGTRFFMRSLFRFPVTSLLGKPIHSAKIVFVETRTQGAGGLPVDAYGLTQPFDENQVNWSTRPSDTGRSLDSVKVGDSFSKGPKEFDITPLAREWANGVPNYGCVIRLARELGAGALRPSFGPSRESSVASQRPQLVVEIRAVEAFGFGCGPVATWPRLELARGTPQLGQTCEARGSLLQPSTATWIAIGLSNSIFGGTALPIVLDPRPAPSCALLVAPDLLLAGRTNANGECSLVFTVPNDPSIRQVAVFMQMATPNPQTGVHSMTSGLSLRIH